MTVIPTFQRPMTMRAGIAQAGSRSQAGPWIPTSPRSALRSPNLGLRIQPQTSAVATPESTAGRNTAPRRHDPPDGGPRGAPGDGPRLEADEADEPRADEQVEPALARA